MEYLIRFAQFHETFRKPEIDALAVLEDIHIEWVSYSEDVGRDWNSYPASISASSSTVNPIFLCLAKRTG